MNDHVLLVATSLPHFLLFAAFPPPSIPAVLFLFTSEELDEGEKQRGIQSSERNKVVRRLGNRVNTVVGHIFFRPEILGVVGILSGILGGVEQRGMGVYFFKG